MAAEGQLPDPFHVAIIMDGNGRWAKARSLPRTAGHKKGAEAVRATVEASKKLGITHLTLFGFSSENWKRPPSEISDLMGLLRLYLRNEIKGLVKNGVRFIMIGGRDAFSEDIQELISEAEQRTRHNTELTLILALNYGGRADISETARALARQVASGQLDPDRIDDELFGQSLSTADIPDPDVLIRTSGEQRISNFLLWQTAYTEFVFTPVLWPDFGAVELEAAVQDFTGRNRRYGGL